LAFLMAVGCASDAKPKSEATVSVSAVNYAEVAPGSDVVGVVNEPATTHPDVPAVSKPTNPIFYLMVPGEVYSSDLPMDAIYHELRLSLQKRGYYNALFQRKAGRPLQVDYLLRLHYGVAPWGKPTVRADKVTWGDDGLLAKRYEMRSLMSNNDFDPRAGLSQDEADNLRRLGLALAGSVKGADSFADVRDFIQSTNTGVRSGDMTPAAHDFCFVVLEAFKFADVNAMNRKAPCIWMIFIAVPIDNHEKMSSLLPTMLKTAEPYYGGTTHGLQVFEVPAGKVEVGEPIEVEGKQ
jgi:hypothetical protein